MSHPASASAFMEGLFGLFPGDSVSDIVLKSPGVAKIKHAGVWKSADLGPLRPDPAAFAATLTQLIPAEKRLHFDLSGAADFAIAHSTSGRRLRVSVFRQQTGLSAVLRVITSEIPELSALGLASGYVESALTSRRGLLLVTGSTGAGKSTTIAATLEHINRTESRHIITVEDPIEVVFSDAQSVFQQRELGRDLPTLHDGLRAALRQSPDVILIGELRDRETAETALQAAESGHLVISTLHARNAASSLQRFMTFFDPGVASRIRSLLAENLVGCLSQRLIPGVLPGTLVLSCEWMGVNAHLRELLLAGAPLTEVEEVIAAGGRYGMKSLDTSLCELVEAGQISVAQALAQASSPQDMQLRLSGIEPRHQEPQI